MKLRMEMEELSTSLFVAPSDRERIKSVLADLSKTSADFKYITDRALGQMSSGLFPRVRWTPAPSPGRCSSNSLPAIGLMLALSWTWPFDQHVAH